MAPTVRIVVLNHDGGDDVLRCLEALTKTEWPSEHLDLLLVDNASSDGSADAVAASFPTVRVVRNTTNLGFPANNLGFVDLDGVDFVGLVNNDAFVTPGWLAPLVATLSEDDRIGAACPKIVLSPDRRRHRSRVERGARLVGPPGTVPGAGWHVPDSIADPAPVAVAASVETFVPAGGGPPSIEPPALSDQPDAAPVTLINNVGTELRDGWFAADRGLHEPDDGRFDEPSDVFAWCGAAVVYPRAYLEDVGGFDERLFLYYEDLELAWRGRSRGWQYRTVPASVVRHRLGASSIVGSTLFRYHVERNRLVVLLRHAPVRVAVVAVVRHVWATGSYAARDVLRPLLRRRRPVPALTWLRLRAFGGFLTLAPHALRQRRADGRRATVRRTAQVSGFRP